MRYKLPKHHPAPTPDPWLIWRFAQELAVDEMDVPRYQHRYCGLAERPGGVVSEKNWRRLKYYFRSNCTSSGMSKYLPMMRS